MAWSRGPAAMAMALMALAGCTDGAGTGQGDGQGTSSASSSTTGNGPTAGDCDVQAPLPLPPTWVAHGGAWAAFVQVDPGHPEGIRGAGDAGDPGLSLLVDHAMGSLSAIEVQASFALVSGTHPDGAGLVFHWTGPSYNIVRYSPSELGWHLFTVIEGNRTKVEPEPIDVVRAVDACEWVTLRIVADGPDVKAYQGEHLILQATLPAEASQAGRSGLFLRGDTVALFDGYSARAA